jgi:hypothetical protein
MSREPLRIICAMIGHMRLPACVHPQIMLPLAASRVGNAISSIVQCSLGKSRSGVGPKGRAHLLRHSLATDMLRKGASLDEIGECCDTKAPTRQLDLCQGGSPIAANAGPALAGRCPMKALNQAVDDYLALRRSLGFKLREYGICLHEFVLFLVKNRIRARHQQACCGVCHSTPT